MYVNRLPSVQIFASHHLDEDPEKSDQFNAAREVAIDILQEIGRERQPDAGPLPATILQNILTARAHEYRLRCGYFRCSGDDIDFMLFESHQTFFVLLILSSVIRMMYSSPLSPVRRVRSLEDR